MIYRIFTIDEIETLLEAHYISFKKVKGNYRIMGENSGSYLNLNKNNYVIYTTDNDYANIVASGLAAVDLKLEPNVNTRDVIRPNKVSCTSGTTLRSLIEIFAKNSNYK